MTLVRFNPFREAHRAPYRVSNFVDDFFNDIPFIHGKKLIRGGLEPLVDIYESENALFIEAELAGITKEDVDVDVEGNTLTFRGERKINNEEKEENYYRRERIYGSFSRSFTLPDSVDKENIKADFKDGVLKIEIPKLPEQKVKKITIH